MGAFHGVSQFFGRALDQVAVELGYGEDNILILRNDLQNLMTRYPDTYRNVMSCMHHADRRTPLEYAQDLVASWLIEDYFLNALTSDYYDIALNGTDKNRKVLPSAKISASSDFLITRPNFEIKLELMNDYTGYWRKNQVLQLRDDKYAKLQRAGSLFIAIATLSSEFAIYDFRNEVSAKYIASHCPYGGKPAYEIEIPHEMLQPIVGNRMEQAIIDLIG